MNLVQIQERLKDAPMQAVMQYANGTNPMVPPYLALAELKRRESVNKSAQMQQDMAQGQQPSVKEQVEQAAGLAALRQQMQQEGMQNLMSQVSPRAIPENVPQPERQPTSEGISSLPVRDMYNFRGGGIVAFSKGGPSVSGQKESEISTGEEELIPLEQMRAEYMRLLRNQQFGSARQLAERIKARQEAESKTVTMPVAQLGEDVRPAPQRAPAAPQMAEQPMAQPMGAPPAERRAGALPPPSTRMAGVLPAPGGIPGQISLPSRRMGVMPSGAPSEVAPTTPARGIASLPGSEEAMQMILGQMRVKPSLEEAAAERKKAEGLFGLTQPYGEERMKRAQAMEAARQQELESRGMERLMRVMGGIGARGLAGASPAYLQSIEAERAADAAFRRQMDELMGGVEAQRRAEAKTGMTETQSRVEQERKSAQEAAGKIMDADTKFKLQELQQKAVRERLSPEEEYIRNEIIKGRKYPEIIEELARAKGATRTEAEAQKAQLRREAEWNEISGDYVRRQEMAKLGVRTLEDYLRYVQRSSGGAGESSTVASGIPPIPAGAVRLKGAQ